MCIGMCIVLFIEYVLLLLINELILFIGSYYRTIKSKSLVIFPVTFDPFLTCINACVMYRRLSVNIARAGV